MREPTDWPRYDLLTHRVRATPDRTALIDDASGEARTYRDLDGRAGRLAGGLAREGIDSGDRIGTLLGTRVAFVELVHAAARLDATLVPLNARLTAGELAGRVERADLDLLVCGADTADRALEVADAPTRAVDPVDREGIDRLEPAPDAPPPVERGRESVALVPFTSGTTGTPKAVRLTAGNLAASATASAFRLGVSPGDRWLVPLPMYHMGGLAPVVRSALYGTTAVVQEGFDAERTARAIGERAITGVSLVPTALTRLLDAGWEPPADLRFVLLGGAPAPDALLERCEARDVPVHPTYGLTETASQVATARPAEAFAHPGTVGQPLAFVEVTVVGPDGGPLPDGEVGELVVEGPVVTPGYGDGERAAEAFGAHGLHTGDAGYRDADGRIWVVDRLDDAITTGGETVYPGEVVEALREHPDVRDAAVVGLEDPEWGERVAALVVGEGIDPGGIERHCRERLAGFKVPRTVGVAQRLPRTASGTVDREGVRERLRDLE